MGMPMRAALAVEPVIRAEIRHALPDLAQHLRHVAIAGILVGRGYAPATASYQMEAAGAGAVRSCPPVTAGP